MADISDVEQKVVDTIAALLYPNGTGNPSAVTARVTVHRGWPLPADLDADMAAKAARVSVWPRGGTERNITPYSDDWVDIDHAAKTLTATVAGNQITIGGTNNQTTAQYVTIQIGQRYVFSYQPAPSDTLAQIAAAIAADINAHYGAASLVGAVITVTGSAYIRATIGSTGNQLSEIRRQVTQVQIVYWASTPALRDAIGKVLEPALASLPFLTLADQSACRWRYMMTIMNDNSEKVGLYRRDTIYTAEYATTLSDTANEVTTTTLNQTAKDGYLGVAPTVTSNIPTAQPQSPVVLPSRLPRYSPLTPN